MSSAYNHVRSRRGEDERSLALFLRKEVEHEEQLETAGIGHQRGEYCEPYNLYSRRRSCKESRRWRPLPSSQMQAEERSDSGGTSKDQLSSCGMTWMKRGGRNANV